MQLWAWKAWNSSLEASHRRIRRFSGQMCVLLRFNPTQSGPKSRTFCQHTISSEPFNIQMMHCSECELKYDEPELENVTRVRRTNDRASSVLSYDQPMERPNPRSCLTYRDFKFPNTPTVRPTTATRDRRLQVNTQTSQELRQQLSRRKICSTAYAVE